jgi:hypothetical protein
MYGTVLGQHTLVISHLCLAKQGFQERENAFAHDNLMHIGV